MERMRYLRKKKGLSGEQIGNMVGVQRSAISKYELGQAQPSQEVLIKIADILNTTTDYLLERTNDSAPPKENQKAPKFQPNRMIAIIKSSGKDNINELATQSGVDVMTYTHWFTGKAEPSLDKVSLIAQSLDVTVDFLMGLVDDPKEKAQKKEAPPSSEMDEREALEQALIKAGIIPADRDLTPEEAKLLFSVAKGVCDSFGI